MDVFEQRCQMCGSRTVRDLLVRDSGQPQRVFVVCDQCGEFVAKYTLSDYYHHGKGLDSYLRGLGNITAESGRDFLDEFARTQAAALSEFELIEQHLRQPDKVAADSSSAAAAAGEAASAGETPSSVPVESREPVAGRYRHFKGKDYLVWNVATHSESEEPLVIYRPAEPGAGWWVRPLQMFQEKVEVEGEQVPRFRYVGPR